MSYERRGEGTQHQSKFRMPKLPSQGIKTSQMRKLFLIFHGCVFAFILLASSGAVFGAVYHGLVSVEDYYSIDSGATHDFNFLTTRLRLDAAKLNEEGTLSFHFDGRERNNLSPKDYNSRYIHRERIDTLNLEYTGIAHMYLTAGRLWPRELSVERVDGANILFQRMNSGIGFFLGTKPDPYTEEFNSNFTSLGGYAFYRKEGILASLALIHNGYKGETDRQYLYGQYSYSPSREILFYGSLTADRNQVSHDIDLTNAIAEVSYRPDYRKSLTAGYNQFQAFRLYRSMEFDIQDSRQQSYYLRGDYRLLDRYTVYGRYERQTLHYQTLEPKLSASDTYQISFRDDNLLNRHIDLDVSMTMADNYSSSYNMYDIQASRFLTETFQLIFSGSSTQTKYDLSDYTDQILTYGVSGYWSLNRKWSLSLSYEGRDARDYTTDTILSRISYKF